MHPPEGVLEPGVGLRTGTRSTTPRRSEPGRHRCRASKVRRPSPTSWRSSIRTAPRCGRATCWAGEPVRPPAAVARPREGRQRRRRAAQRREARRGVPRGAPSRLVLRADQLPAVGSGIAYIIQDSGEGGRVARALRRGHLRGRRAGEGARQWLARVGPGLRDVEAALAEQPTTAEERAAGAAMHYTGTTGKPRAWRKLSDFDPDVMAELFTGFFGLFGIPHREDQVHLCTSPLPHGRHHLRRERAQLRAPSRVHGQVGSRADAREDPDVQGHHTHMVPFHRMLQLPDDVKAATTCRPCAGRSTPRHRARST